MPLFDDFSSPDDDGEAIHNPMRGRGRPNRGVPRMNRRPQSVTDPAESS